MSLSTKWTAVSLFALTAIGAGSIAFAGCTVTSGSPTDVEGGVVTPTDGGGGDTSTPVDGGNACPGNTGQKADLVNATCQANLNVECCPELTALFTMAGVPATSDGNVYAACIADCKKPAADGAAPTTAEIADCEGGQTTDNPPYPYGGICGSNASKAIVDAYDALTTCISKPTGMSLATCQ